MPDNAHIGGQSTTPRVNVRKTFDRVDADLSICALVVIGEEEPCWRLLPGRQIGEAAPQ